MRIASHVVKTASGSQIVIALRGNDQCEDCGHRLGPDEDFVCRPCEFWRQPQYVRPEDEK